MTTLARVAAMAAAAVGLTVGATAAGAQSWGYDQYRADRAYHDAGHQAAAARRDERRADIAARYGDYRAADHYARAADHHRRKASRDVRYGRYEQGAARWDDRHGGWGY